jgi:hypothetical protein
MFMMNETEFNYLQYSKSYHRTKITNITKN